MFTDPDIYDDEDNEGDSNPLQSPTNNNNDANLTEENSNEDQNLNGSADQGETSTNLDASNKESVEEDGDEIAELDESNDKGGDLMQNIFGDDSDDEEGDKSEEKRVSYTFFKNIFAF